jgi:hypothetical protein
MLIVEHEENRERYVYINSNYISNYIYICKTRERERERTNNGKLDTDKSLMIFCCSSS